MTDSARSRIFARLGRSTGNASPDAIRGELESLGHAPVAELPDPDLSLAFLVNVLKNLGTADIARNRSDAVKAVGQYLYRHYRTHRLVAGHDPRLAAMPWRDGGVLPRFGSAEQGEPVALSYARLGVAELGAVVTYTGRANPAANNLLSEHHIVLVNCEDLVADMDQAWHRINTEAELDHSPRGVNFIAGPSSTTDIEGQLVYGAHGPRGWHVILLGEMEPSVLGDARRIAGA